MGSLMNKSMSKHHDDSLYYECLAKLILEKKFKTWKLEISDKPDLQDSVNRIGIEVTQALLDRIIKACSNEGDTVLDPFSGSGTTCFVAKKLNRKYIGIEKDKEFFNISKRRIDSI